ncbi:ABC transporter ATP-binding protein [Umezawaea sp. NPDC059074]|uniref:ABC transporter ATP-binding protein n=1 Tax=Umezawaea sp. NPDC059074 TaxID=3346716 RepID=UPI0036A90C54
MSPLVEVGGLRLRAGDRAILDGVDLTVADGEAVGLVGASGSGKTTLALAVLGHLRSGVRHDGGRVLVRGQVMLPDPAPGVRGGTIGYVGQDPGASLNPYARISSILRTAGGQDVGELLDRVGLTSAFARRYPHQLSGGQQQRVVLAAALARSPRLLVLDEPTTALDLVAKAEVLHEVRRLRDTGVALLWVSHDLGTVRSLVDRVVVLDDGKVVDDRPVREMVTTSSPRTARRPAVDRTVVLSGRSLGAGYHGTDVLTGIDFDVHRGECLAVLGVSGVGKSTLARCLAGLHRPSAGEVLLHGVALAPDVRGRTGADRAAIGLVAQNPADALHPRQDVRTALARPLRLLRGLRGCAEQDAEVARLLDAVRLPAAMASRQPGELSGGQRQRVALARALAGRPEVLLCDEVTSALDTGTQAEVLDLLTDLRADLGVAVLLITHDPWVAASASDGLLVLAGGRVVSSGPTADLLPAAEDPEALVARLLVPPSPEGASLV